MAAPLQNGMKPTIAIARLLPRQLQQILTQLCVAIPHRLITIAGTIRAQQLAGPEFAQSIVRLSERNIFP
jgi:hypothetical protein